MCFTKCGGVVRVAEGVVGVVEVARMDADPHVDVPLQGRIHHAVQPDAVHHAGGVPTGPIGFRTRLEARRSCWSLGRGASLGLWSAAKLARKNHDVMSVGNANGSPRKGSRPRADRGIHGCDAGFPRALSRACCHWSAHPLGKAKIMRINRHVTEAGARPPTLCEPSAVGWWLGQSAPSRWTPSSSRATGDTTARAVFLRWEFSRDLHSWDQARTRAGGQAVVRGLFQRELPDRRAALVNNITRWGYGILNGASYGVLAGSVRIARIRYGLPFGQVSGAPATSSCLPPSCTSRSGSTTGASLPRTCAHTWSSGSAQLPLSVCSAGGRGPTGYRRETPDSRGPRDRREIAGLLDKSPCGREQSQMSCSSLS